jgi:hypothetical protein
LWRRASSIMAVTAWRPFVDNFITDLFEYGAGLYYCTILVRILLQNRAPGLIASARIALESMIVIVDSFSQDIGARYVRYFNHKTPVFINITIAWIDRYPNMDIPRT